MSAVNATFAPNLPTPAVAEGGAFSLPAGHPATLAELLARAAHDHPRHGVYYLGAGEAAGFQSYPALLEDAARRLAGLRALGLQPGDPVLFQLGEQRDFITCFWACALGGFVPVPLGIAPTYEAAHNLLARLARVWALLDRPPTLADAALAPRLRAFAAREGLAGFEVASVADLDRYPPAEHWHKNAPDDPALLLLTSGSTGTPKAVVQTHGNLIRWAESVARACDFSAADVSLNWMPLDHVGGLVMFHLRDLATGCDQYHAQTERVLRNPLLWLDWIDRYRATITWAPNFAFGLVNERAADIAGGRWDLSSMKFILNGGEAIVSRTARRFLELLLPHGLPATAMRPAWGMSETSSGVTYSRAFTLETTADADPFVAVGPPIPGIALRVVDGQDVPVAEGRVGRLQIRGISVTPGYHRNPEENARAFTADGWFNTGDLATLSSGSLTIAGRDKDVIIVNGVNFHSHEIEGVVEELEGVEVSYTAACAVRIPGEDTDRLAIFFSPTAGAGPRRAELIHGIRAAVAGRIGVMPDFIFPVEPAEIPKTAIGKIQRSELKRRFEQGDFAAAPAAETVATALFHKVWRESPPPDPANLPVGSRVLLFMDPAGLCRELLSRLHALGHECVTVDAGDGFAASASGFRIDPDRPEDYVRLFEALPAPVCTHLVYAWAYSPAPAAEDWPALAAAQSSAALPLLSLLRAWPGAAPVRWTLVSQGLQATDGEALDIARSPLVGLARTLPHEFQGIEVTHLDFDGLDPARHVDPLLALLATPGAPAELAIRDERWLAPVLEPLLPAERAPAFQTGGLYLISGGLGGIGQALARHLATRYRARLLLLGQSPLPESGRPASARDAERLSAYQALAETGADLIYLAGDIADPGFVQAAVAEATRRWQCPLAGILHLAGLYHDASLADETADGFLHLLRPKLGGALALDAVARDYPGSLFVHFSSVLANFGSFGAGAYAAANACLEPFAQRQRRLGLQSYCIVWSLWPNTGMGRHGDAEAARLRGYRVLEVPDGLALLEQTLARGRSPVIAGLDPSHPAVAGPAGRAAGPEAYVAPRNPLEARLAGWWQELLGLPKVGVKDNFFALGGRSLLAAQLFARIEKELLRALPVATLFQCPTVEALAARLAEDDAAESCHILAIQAQGSRPPFFCIPGVGSDAITFQDLAEALGLDQPFYGLQARGLDATPMEGDPPEVEDIAAGFVAAIRKAQPEGPYFVGGHCFGSLLAWEVARQMAAQGLAVGRLVLLDPIVSNVLTDNRLGRDRLLYHWHKLRRTPLLEQGRFLLEKLRNFSRTVIARQRVGRSYAMAERLHSRYRLGAFPGRVTIFLAEDSYFQFAPERDPRRYYERLAEDGAEYIPVPGDHHSILHGRDVIQLAAKLRDCLAGSVRA